MAAAKKITRALAGQLRRSRGSPVKGIVFAALETASLPLTSFSVRAAARDQEVRRQLSAILEAIRRWEATHGQTVPLAVRPDSASVALTAPAELFLSLADEGAVAVLDVDTDT